MLPLKGEKDLRSKSERFLIFFSEMLDPLFVEQASVRIPQRDGIFRLPERRFRCVCFMYSPLLKTFLTLCISLSS